ncbi:MAG: hypothetical protein IKP40_07070 [Clostridia bacterium]|nr:hypothetical protein [Clostridia bacterium]
MRKRLLINLIVLALLLTGCALSEEWKPYELPEHAVDAYFLTDRDRLVTARDDNYRIAYLLWYRDGALLRETAFEKVMGQRIHPLKIEDDQCFFLVERTVYADPDDMKGQIHLTLYRWGEAGLLVCREWQFEDGSIAGSLRHGFMVMVKDESSCASLTLYDWRGDPLWGPETFTPDASQSSLRFLIGNGKGDWAVDFYGKSLKTTQPCTWLFTNHQRTGEIREKLSNSMLPSGKIPVRKKLEDTNYSPVRLTIFSPEGQRLCSATLHADRLVLSIMIIRENDDGSYEVYGSAVANSRRTYLIWHISTDAQLHQTALDVRSLNHYRDYGAYLVPQPNGTIWVFVNDLDTFSHPPVLIPFDVLPTASAHGIRLE